jgi:hypothetical protein
MRWLLIDAAMVGFNINALLHSLGNLPQALLFAGFIAAFVWFARGHWRELRRLTEATIRLPRGITMSVSSTDPATVARIARQAADMAGGAP